MNGIEAKGLNVKTLDVMIQMLRNVMFIVFFAAIPFAHAAIDPDEFESEN